MITRQIWGKNEMSWKRPLNCHLRRCNNLLKPRRKLVKIANSGSTLLHLVPSCSRLIALTTKRRNIKRRRMQRVNNGHCRRSVRCNLCSRMFHGRISLTSHQIHHYKWSNACLIVTQNSSMQALHLLYIKSRWWRNYSQATSTGRYIKVTICFFHHILISLGVWKSALCYRTILY